MKILYGVQATGNGHITRARALNKHFQEFNLDVDFLFSGRERDQLWDMEEFGNWQWRRGLTFQHESGELKVARTLRENSIKTLVNDIKQLDLSTYDLVLTDFEPVTAWAARQQKKTCIGIGHQYAFAYDVPVRGAGFIASAIMKYFAPAEIHLGLHWHHFNAPILPPIAETQLSDAPSDPNKIIVYLGFEDAEKVIQWLEPFEQHLFVFYGPFPQYESRGHIQLKPLSREGFKNDLASASGVICNAGFELSSEAIQLGKRLLVKPLQGQMEQLSNASALEALGLGQSMDTLDTDKLKGWLNSTSKKRVAYPNVAREIARWISLNDWHNTAARQQVITNLWKNTRARDVQCFESQPTPTLDTYRALLNNV